MTRHSHPLALRQIHTSVQILLFSRVVVQWNTLQADVVVMPTLPQFSVAVRSLDHQFVVTIDTTDLF